MRAALATLLLLAGCTATHATVKPTAPAAPPPPPWTRTEPPPSLPEVPRRSPHREVQVMPNGLRVVVEEHHARPLVDIRLLFPSGAADDTDAAAGATYFALQLLVGTYDEKDAYGELKDPYEKSARRVVAELGAALVVEVDSDYSALGVNGFSRDTSAYLAHLRELVAKPRHGEATFAALADAAVDRLNELEVSDSEVLEQYLGRLAFGEGSAWARPIWGTPASIARIGIEDVAARQQELLTPVGTTLLVAGDVEPSAVFRLVRRTLGAWYPPAPRAGSHRPPRTPRTGKRRHVVFLPRTGAKTTLVCAARRFDEKKVPAARLAVVAHLLGARLDDDLRDRRHLTYGAWAVPLRHRGTRAMLACTRLDATQTEAGLSAFLDELSGLALRPPTDEEVETARAVMTASWQASQDGLSSAVARDEQAFGLREDADTATKVAEVQKVTGPEAQALAQEVAKVDHLQLVVSGESGPVRLAVQHLKLGAVHVPRLDRVEEQNDDDD